MKVKHYLVATRPVLRSSQEAETTIENKPHIIVTGDPLDGFKFYGPFANWDEAWEIAEADWLSESVWWCAPLETLTKAEDSISPSSASNR